MRGLREERDARVVVKSCHGETGRDLGFVYIAAYIKPALHAPLSRYVHTGVRMAFSDTWLKANNGKERAALEERCDREGLGVRITPKGKITFQLRYRYQGAAKRLDLGSYPLMSLKEARSEAQRLRAQHEQGQDPQVVRLCQVFKGTG